jgi:hypothetical protein
VQKGCWQEPCAEQTRRRHSLHMSPSCCWSTSYIVLEINEYVDLMRNAAC